MDKELAKKQTKGIIDAAKVKAKGIIDAAKVKAKGIIDAAKVKAERKQKGGGDDKLTDLHNKQPKLLGQITQYLPREDRRALTKTNRALRAAVKYPYNKAYFAANDKKFIVEYINALSEISHEKNIKDNPQYILELKEQANKKFDNRTYIESINACLKLLSIGKYDEYIYVLAAIYKNKVNLNIAALSANTYIALYVELCKLYLVTYLYTKNTAFTFESLANSAEWIHQTLLESPKIYDDKLHECITFFHFYFLIKNKAATFDISHAFDEYINTFKYSLKGDDRVFSLVEFTVEYVEEGKNKIHSKYVGEKIPRKLTENISPVRPENISEAQMTELIEELYEKYSNFMKHDHRAITPIENGISLSLRIPNKRT